MFWSNLENFPEYFWNVLKTNLNVPYKLKVSEHSEKGQSTKQVRMFRNTSKNVLMFWNNFEIFSKQIWMFFRIFLKCSQNKSECFGNKLKFSECSENFIKQVSMFRNEIQSGLIEFHFQTIFIVWIAQTFFSKHHEMFWTLLNACFKHFYKMRWPLVH